MTQFQKDENKGRDIFRKFASSNPLITQLSFSEDDYSCYDCILTSGGTLFIGEIKYRNFCSNKYPDYILEKKKVDNLKLNFPEKQILYINIFYDTIKIWNVTNLNLPLYTKSLPKTTSITSEKIIKEYYLLS